MSAVEAYSVRRAPDWREVGEIAISVLIEEACDLDIDAIVATAIPVPDRARKVILELESRAAPKRSGGRKLAGIHLDPRDRHDRVLFIRAALWVIDATAWVEDRARRCVETLVSTSDAGESFWFSADVDRLSTVKSALAEAGYDPNAWLDRADAIYPGWVE